MFWVAIFLTIASAQEPVTIASKTAKMQKQDGYFPFYWEERTGKLYLEIPRFGQEFLYVHSLPAGLGSNDIGLDRGQLGQSRIVRFDRSGPKVLLVQPNYDFRALSKDENEVRAVRESFAESVLWGFTAIARRMGGCWWMPRTSTCAMRMLWRSGCRGLGKDRTGWRHRDRRCICLGRRIFRRTPRWRRC